MKHYTTGDIAEALGVEPSTVRAYNAREQMPKPSGHVGRTPYWTPEDIEPWLKGVRRGAAAVLALIDQADPSP